MKRIIFSALTAVLIISCSKDNNNIDEQPNTQEILFPKKVTTSFKSNNDSGAEVSVVEVIEAKMENGKLLAEVFTMYEDNEKVDGYENTMTYENNLLKTLTHLDTKKNKIENKTTYNYAGGKLVEEIEENDNAQESKTVAYKYTNDRLTEIQYNRKDSDLKFPQVTKFVYPSATEIQEIEHFSIVTNGIEYAKVRTNTHTLDAQKRIIKTMIVDERSKETIEYQYDDKNNHLYYQLDMPSSPTLFIDPISAKNNVISEKRIKERLTEPKRTEVESVDYTYQYNDKRYPIKIKRVHKENDKVVQESTIEITYY
ncbi:hypothetical protein CAPN004_00650 [Capnocytophaga cynodegmi]|uniref:hypothetical protein n=1 Tax=Capnocytophaga cynodegmi TaxID=28189 RepID=UPI001ACA24F6|nr:hypothetical protein [Capnocytophaga cynodegmi]GIM51035.1 hypothetical protein CAPN004_00650 [Capnocytophaga cynodegmi]